MSYNERSALLIQHSVQQQVEIGSCYVDGVQTAEHCFVCKRYACKAHRRDCYSWEERSIKFCDKLVEQQDYTRTLLGVVCLEHYRADPKPEGFPKRRCTPCGKIFCAICVPLSLFVLGALAYVATHQPSS